uniref:Uncharacterized protein n=1 Tax=Meloidogyne enterolobii TaxID=390850 RepID=A0A6V7VNM1_MELEN|nr:unnamed protein product [Meloidogyne enterolobii]
MAYATKYYDYQVAIIFLILLAGMALLALVVGAIYFICVVNMRNNKKGTTGFSRYPSARSTVRSSRFEEWPSHQRQQTQTFPQQQQQYSPHFEGIGPQTMGEWFQLVRDNKWGAIPVLNNSQLFRNCSLTTSSNKGQ